MVPNEVLKAKKERLLLSLSSTIVLSCSLSLISFARSANLTGCTVMQITQNNSKIRNISSSNLWNILILNDFSSKFVSNFMNFMNFLHNFGVFVTVCGYRRRTLTQLICPPLIHANEHTLTLNTDQLVSNH